VCVCVCAEEQQPELSRNHDLDEYMLAWHIMCVYECVCVCVCVWRLQQILVQSSEHVLINTNVWVLYWHIKMSGVRGKGNAHSSNLQLVVLLVIATPHSYPSLQHDREPCRELNI